MSINDRCHPDITIGPLTKWVIPMADPPLQAKVITENTSAELIEFQQRVKEQLEKASAEQRVKDLDHQIEFLQSRIKWFDRVMTVYWAIVIGGLLLLLFGLAWQCWQEVAK